MGPELVRLAPDIVPPSRDAEERGVPADTATLARFLLAAPRLVGSPLLAEATAAVQLFAHQRKVVERLAGSYPRSWLVADEVGLGKTISAGLSLRRLLLSGEARRVLVLAPANVCRQWQDELFEKFGLWPDRLDRGRFVGAHPDDVEPVAAGANPYAERDLLVVSSHLARRSGHQEQILAAPPFDLIIVDEAHHARRRAADLREYRPSRLLQLLDRVHDQRHARAVWLLTATPMQVHAIELVDVLRHVGLSGAMAAFENFSRFYAELATHEEGATDWPFLHRMLAERPVIELDPDEEALLAQIRGRLGIVQADRIRRFGQPGEDPSALVEALNPEGRRELRAWVRELAPVGRYVTATRGQR